MYFFFQRLSVIFTKWKQSSESGMYVAEGILVLFFSLLTVSHTVYLCYMSGKTLSHF